MQELVVFAIRAAFLVLLWVFVVSAVLVVRSDLVGGRTRGRDTEPKPSRRERRQAAKRPADEQRRAPTPRLLVVDGSLAGTSLPLGNAPVVIGRNEDAGLVLPDDYASGRHARLSPRDGEWVIEDLQSTNGTFVDGRRVTRATPVRPGRPIRIGRTTLELRR